RGVRNAGDKPGRIVGDSQRCAARMHKAREFPAQVPSCDSVAVGILDIIQRSVWVESRDLTVGLRQDVTTVAKLLQVAGISWLAEERSRVPLIWLEESLLTD